MINGQTMLAVIPARGGSKGLPRKNLKPLAGRPLIFYAINEARKSKYLDRVVVSTDDAEIARVAKSFGAEIVQRPAQLAQDHSTTPDALIHALTELKGKNPDTEPDAVVLLQATTPLRTVVDIDIAIELFAREKPDSVVSVCEAPSKMNPHWVRKIEDGLLKPYLDEDQATPHMMRQELPKVYWRNGMIYIVKKDVLRATKNLYGQRCIPYLMEPRYRVNIDEPADFMLLERLLEEGLVQLDSMEANEPKHN